MHIIICKSYEWFYKISHYWNYLERLEFFLNGAFYATDDVRRHRYLLLFKKNDNLSVKKSEIAT